MTTEEAVWYVCNERCRKAAGAMAFQTRPVQVPEGRTCPMCGRTLGGQWGIELRPVGYSEFTRRHVRRKVKCDSPSLF